MRPILPLLAVLYAGQPSQPQNPTLPLRCVFAALLEDATAHKRKMEHVADGTAKIEACGLEYRVLVIHDDSEEARVWFNALAKDRGTMEGLLQLGFRAVILVNKKHGTFVFDLTSSKSLPELSEKA